MLSAIAARKATQASKPLQATAHQATLSVESKQFITRDDPPTSDADISQSQKSLKGRKRRISSALASGVTESPSWFNERRTKKKKSGRYEQSRINNRRYYESDDHKTAEEEDDIIVLNGGGSPASAGTPTSELSEDEDGLASRSPSRSGSEFSQSRVDGEIFQRSVGLTNVQHTVVDAQDMQLILSNVSLKPNINFFRLGPSSHAEDLDQDNACVAVILSPNDTLSFAGVYSLTVLKGAIALYGAELRESPQSHRVFAPLCSPLPVITALSYLQLPASGNNGLDLGFFDLPLEILANLRTDQTLVVLRDLQTGLEGIGRICKTFERAFKPLSSLSNDGVLRTAEIVYRMPVSLQPLLFPPTWSEALSKFPSGLDISFLADSRRNSLASEPLVILVKGPKRTGKSTFSRSLANRLSTSFKRVAFLECDVGQTEFTPPGILALNVLDSPVFGPPFTHPAIPYQAHYLGSTSPKTSPTYYLAAIESLLQSYRLELQFSSLSGALPESDPRISTITPLVVNMMGWTKGLGADITRKIEEMVQPTHIFNFRSPYQHHDEAEHVSWGADRDARHQFFQRADIQYQELNPIAGDALSARFSAADWRTISLLSYLHANFNSTIPDLTLNQLRPSSGCVLTWNTSIPLLDHIPYVIDVRAAFNRVVLACTGAEDVVSSELGRVLNGAVVALVQSDAGNDFTEPDTSSSFLYQQGGQRPDPHTSSCLGLAVIRAVSPGLFIDPLSAIESPGLASIQLLTPINPGSLQSARCLVKGDVELPVWGMLDFRNGDGPKNNIPYLQWGKGEGIGGERRRVRRNLMRKSQM